MKQLLSLIALCTISLLSYGQPLENWEADKIKVTGNKLEDKKYYTHTLYPGGLKTKVLKDILETKPEYIIEEAVKGMLPKNKLGKQMFKKLKVFKGTEHPHESQQPTIWEPKI